MKTIIGVGNTRTQETMRRLIDSFQVLAIGLLIPFLFVKGITTDHNNKVLYQNKYQVNKSINGNQKTASIPPIGRYLPY